MQEKESQNAIIILDRLKEAYNITTDTELASFLGVKQNTVASWRSRNTVDYSLIISKCDNISLDWLFTGKGAKEHQIQHTANKVDRVSLIDYESNIRSIPIVDVSAAAGHGYFNSDYTETLGEINLPTALLQSKYGNYYCGIVNGESMAPTLLNQDYIIFRLLTSDEWIDMKDGRVYFIVDRSGSSFVKRIKNNLKSEGSIICMSDSIDKANFRDFTIAGDDLANIYHVEWHFSKDLSNINDLYYDRLGTLEADMKEIKEKFKKLK